MNFKRIACISLIYLARDKLPYCNFLSTAMNFLIKKSNYFVRGMTLVRWIVLLPWGGVKATAVEMQRYSSLKSEQEIRSYFKGV
jgi:hypothetical protein